MKKTLILTLLVLALSVSMVLPAFGAATVIIGYENPPLVVDYADLLTTSEENALSDKLEEISERQKLDVVVYTVDSLDGLSPMNYADDVYDYSGYGYGSNYDGILLLISMEDRDYWMTTCGYGITAFTDAGLDYIADQFLSDLSDGNYAEAFTIFADECDRFITQARNGDPFDSHNLPKEPFSVVFNLAVALVIAFVIALIVVSIMKGQLKSVRTQAAAKNYVTPGSLNVTVSRDLFLYANVSRREKPKSSSGSSTHRSSSGRSHGGSGGRF